MNCRPSKREEFMRNGMCMCDICLMNLFGSNTELGVALTLALGGDLEARDEAKLFLKAQGLER